MEDEIVQEMARCVLDAIYEPVMASTNSPRFQIATKAAVYLHYVQDYAQGSMILEAIRKAMKEIEKHPEIVPIYVY